MRIVSIDRKRDSVKFVRETKGDSVFNGHRTRHIGERGRVFNPNQTPLGVYKNTTLNVIKHTPPDYV